MKVFLARHDLVILIDIFRTTSRTCYEVANKIIKAGKSGRKYSKVGIVRSVVNYVFSVKSAYMSFGYLFKTRYP